MYRPGVTVSVIAIVAGLLSWVDGQQSGWVPNQVNAMMCAWKALRAAQLKDTAYLDGGFLYWIPGFANGDVGAPTQDGNPLGLTYTLNFSVPFDSNTNVSEILKTISLSSDGSGTNNLKPNYYDGAMLANDYEFFLYGGLLKNTQAYSLPDADDVLYYQASDYGVSKSGFRPGFSNGKLPGNMTRYVTYGGAANAPSENKAWYFGGSRSPSWGPIYQPGDNDSFNPTNVSNTFITLDLSKSQSAKWTNATLPPGIPSRANPSMVWVPVGEQGILVVLGGVAYPQYSTSDQMSLNEAQSEKDSPGYMTNVDIYDVASGEWYQQPTTGAPSPLAMGCAVVATANDSSSYNIYYYGGYDGLHVQENFSDDVWVLSLPSFTWTRLYQGRLSHARAGHQCLTPYPDQMVTVGGFRSSKGGGLLCLEGGILQVFNLTSGAWLSSYDPNNWNKYGVPDMIQSKIGGDYAGGATLTAPTPSWAATELASIFAAKYQTSKITSYFPYSSQSPENGTRGDWDDGKRGGGGGTPSWVAPVLGVVLGLVFLTAIAVGILLYRRRSLLRKRSGGTDSSGGDEHHNFINTWLSGHNTEKAPTITTDNPSSRYDDMRSRNNTPMPSVGYTANSSTPEMTQRGIQHEMPANPRFELGDTSRTAELGGEALPYTDVITRYTQLHSPTSPHSGSPHSVLKSPSIFTGSVSQDQPSSLSSSQAGINPAAASAAMARERPDSPSLGRASPMRTPPPNRDAVVSDLSRISEHHMSHLRNLSGGTVSSTSNSGPSPPTTPPAMQTSFNIGPVSPPLPSPPSGVHDHEASDYVSMYQSMGATGSNAHAGPARGPRPSSSLRLSIFRENSEDLGDRPSHSHTQ